MKKTKFHLLFTILMMAVISVSLTSCGDDNNTIIDEPDPYTNTDPTPAELKQMLIGTWLLNNSDGNYEAYVFRADGTGEVYDIKNNNVSESCSMNYTFDTSKMKISINLVKSSTITINVKQLTNTTLVDTNDWNYVKVNGWEPPIDDSANEAFKQKLIGTWVYTYNKDGKLNFQSVYIFKEDNTGIYYEVEYDKNNITSSTFTYSVDASTNSITTIKNTINSPITKKLNDFEADGYLKFGDWHWLYYRNDNWQVPTFDDGDEYAYVDLGLPSGTLWATMNVGASSPEEYGDFFAWGEVIPRNYFSADDYKWCSGWDTETQSLYGITKYCTSSFYGTIDNRLELEPEDDAATVNWGEKWRMPSIDQIKELINGCTSSWTTVNGVNGRLFISKYNGVSLFFPAAGYRQYWKTYEAGTSASYWSRTLSVNNSCADDMYIDSNEISTGLGSYREIGQSVRAVRMR